jgi:hypothetical protein
MSNVSLAHLVLRPTDLSVHPIASPVCRNCDQMGMQKAREDKDGTDTRGSAFASEAILYLHCIHASA